MPESPVAALQVEPPRGIRQAHVDAKGRLKLPAVFQQYLTGLGELKVFITSLDGRTARIYPISVWRENEKIFESFNEDPFAAEDISFAAYEVGADGELDSEGRLLVPQELRKRLNLENQPVWLHYHKGRINVYNSQVYQEMQTRASLDRVAKLRQLEQKGLK